MEKFSLVISSMAEADLADSYTWYETRREGLGHQFLASVDTALESIHDNPNIYPIMYRDMRRALLHRFPYAVFYLVHERRITVIAVLHCRQSQAHLNNR